MQQNTLYAEFENSYLFLAAIEQPKVEFSSRLDHSLKLCIAWGSCASSRLFSEFSDSCIGQVRCGLQAMQ